MEKHNISKKEDANMVFGVHPVEEVIKAGKELEKVFVQSRLRSPQISEIVKFAKEHEVPVQFVPVEKLNRLTRKNHQGIVAFVCPITYQNIENVIPMVYDEGRMPFVVILDRVTDVRNRSYLLRRWCGCHHNPVSWKRFDKRRRHEDICGSSFVDKRVPRRQYQRHNRFSESQRIESDCVF